MADMESGGRSGTFAARRESGGREGATRSWLRVVPDRPGSRVEDWEVDAPTGQDLDTVRCVVDDIDGPVQG
jgi:hypothetical protein